MRLPGLQRLILSRLCRAILPCLVLWSCGGLDDGSAPSLGQETRLTTFDPVVAQDFAGEKVAILAVSERPRVRAGRWGLGYEVSVRGHFLAFVGVDRETVLKHLGIPPLLRFGAVDSCSIHRATPSYGMGIGENHLSSAPADSWGAVALLDAGDLHVELGRRRWALDYRYYPEHASYVSGPTYSGRVEVAGRHSSSAGAARVTGRGSVEVGAFDVEVALPPPLRLLAVGGRSVSGAGDVGFVPTEPLRVTWTPLHDADEPVLIEWTRRSFGALDTVFCVAVDDGEFSIPAELYARLPAHGDPSTERLVVRRAVATEFYAQGMDEGWFFAISEDSVTLLPL